MSDSPLNARPDAEDASKTSGDGARGSNHGSGPQGEPPLPRAGRSDPPGGHEREEQLAASIEAFEAAQRRGEEVTVDGWLERFPDLASDLSELLPSLVLMQTVARRVSEDALLDEALESIPASIGEYRIERRIGRGGMGAVYLAVQESLSREVALKVLPTTLEIDATFLERFRREARVAGRLAHPHIVPVYGVGYADGRHYFAMRHIDGPSLDAVQRMLRQGLGSAKVHEPTASSVRTAAREGHGRSENHEGHSPESLELARMVDTMGGAGHEPPQSLSIRASVRVALQVADALEYAHSQGVLHRDIKPGNILLDKRGDAWVTDFGLCRIEDAGNMTSEGAILGTLRYMAPEQIEGSSSETSDVYATGLLLFELLALRPAFDSSRRAKVVHDVLHVVPPRLRRLRPGTPRVIETIVQKATAKLPDERYPSAAALARDLRAFLENRPISARRPSALYLARLFVTRHRLAASVAAVALVLLSVLGALYVRDLRASRQESDRIAYAGALVASEAALRDGSIQRAKHHLARAPDPYRSWEWSHLSARVDQALRSHRVADGPLAMLAVPSDGSRVAVAGRQGVTVLALPSLAIECVVTTEPARGVAWDSAGNRLVLVLENGRIQVVEREPTPDEGGHAAYTFVAKINERWMGDQTSAHIAIRNDLVLIGTDRGTVHLWDFERWALVPLVSLPGPIVSVGLELEADGTPAWWACATSSLVIGEGGGPRDPGLHGARGEQRIVEFALGGDTVSAAVLDPDGRTGVLATHGGVVMEFDAIGGALRRLFGANRSLADLAIDRGTVLAVGQDKLVHLIDRASGRRQRGLSGSPHPLNAVVRTGGPAPLLLTAGEDGVVRAWDPDVAGGSVGLVGHVDEVLGLAIEPAGRLLVTGGRDGLVIVWDLARAEPIARFVGAGGPVAAAVFMTDRLSGRAHGVFASTAAGELHAFPLEPGEARQRALRGGARVYDAAWDESGQRVLLATSDGVVAVGPDLQPVGVTWLAGLDVAALTIDESLGTCLAVLAEGRIIALELESGAVRYDVRTGRGCGRHGVAVRAERARSTDGRRDGPWRALGAFGTTSDGVLVFDALTGAVDRFLSSSAEDGEVGEQFVGAAFSPFGDRVLTTTRNGLLSVWDRRRGEHVVDLRGHEFFARRVTTSPASGVVVSVAIDASIHVWTPYSTRELTAQRDTAEPLRPLAELRRTRAALEPAAMLDELWRELSSADAPLTDASWTRLQSLYRRGAGDPVVAALYGLARARVEPSAEGRALMAFALARLPADDARRSALRAAVAAYDRARLLADTTLIRGSVEAPRLRPNPSVQRAIGALTPCLPWPGIAEFVAVAAPLQHAYRTLRRYASRR